MAAELKVGIGVDATGLDTGLDQASNQLTNFGRDVQQQTRRAGSSFQGMARVMQDAAFGPGAIANNLSALGDDFRQLSESARESGQSIGRTLVQSLTGAGGMNLALAGLTLGLSLASFGLEAWSRAFGSSADKTKESKDALKAHNEELKEFVDNLGAVTQAQLKGSQNAQNELTDLKSLFTAYQNANLPLERRRDAYKQLQDQYPDYFKNIAFEESASKKTTDAYNKLTASILATAQARAFNDKITKNTEEKLTLEEKEAQVAKELFKVKADLAKAEEREFQASTISEGQFAIATKKANDLRERKNALDKEYTQILKEQRGIVAQNAQLAGRVQELIGQGAEITDISNKKNKEDNDRIKDKIKLQKDFMKSLGVKGPTLTAPTIKIPQELLDFNKTLRDKVVTPIIEIGPILRQGFFDAFAGIGEAIGTALATGGNFIEAFGQSVLSSMGSILIEFGKLTIAAGVASLGLAEALKNPFGGGGALAIAAGVALVAIGSAVKAFSGSLGGSSSGGGGGSSTSAPSAVPRGFQASAPSGFALAGGSGANQFQFTLKGADLVASIDRTRSLNSRQGAR